jgi:hypothetical protein
MSHRINQRRLDELRAQVDAMREQIARHQRREQIDRVNAFTLAHPPHELVIRHHALALRCCVALSRRSQGLGPDDGTGPGPHIVDLATYDELEPQFMAAQEELQAAADAWWLMRVAESGREWQHLKD